MTNEKTQNKPEEKSRQPIRKNNYRGRKNSNQERKGEEKTVEIRNNIVEQKKEELPKMVQTVRSARNSRNTRNTAIAKKTEGKVERRGQVKVEEKANFEFKKENLKIIPLRRIRRNWKKYNCI